MPKSSKPKPKRFFRVFFICLALMCVVALLTRLFVFEPVRVVNDGMSPTYRKGDVVFTSKIDQLTGWSVSRNDIVLAVFSSANAKFLRRVAGMPGDVIEQNADGRAYLLYADNSGAQQRLALGACPDLQAGTLPEDSYLLLCDRLSSGVNLDGRGLGLVHSTDIRAKAGAVIWPLDRMFRGN